MSWPERAWAKWPPVLALCLLTSGCDDEVVGFGTEGSGTIAEPDTETPEATSTGSTPTGTTGEPTGSTGAADVLPTMVAFGFEEGLAVSFDDGASWSAVGDVDAPEIRREGAAASAEAIVIVGGGHTLFSTDGLSWEGYGDVSLGYGRDAAYGGGVFVNVGLDRASWSPDGWGWTDAREGVLGFDYSEVVYGDDRFVAIGPGWLGMSEDGLSWTHTPLTGAGLKSIAFGAGRFVAVGDDARALTTTDGVTVDSDVEGGPGLTAVRYCDGEFVAAAGGLVRVSSDGVAWSEFAVPVGGTLACGQGRYATTSEGAIKTGASLMALEAVFEPPGTLHELAYTGPPFAGS